MKHQVSRALSAIVSVFWVESQTNNVPAPADHAIEAKEMKDLAEKNIVGVAGKLTGYDHNACKDSAKTLMDELTKSLVDLNRPFKYIGAYPQFWLVAPCPTYVSLCSSHLKQAVPLMLRHV